MSRSTLVTGGAGFIGSHLVDTLIDSGARVTVLDDLSTGHTGNLRHHHQAGMLTLVSDTILDADLVDRLVAQHEVVFHLAAAVGVRHILRDPISALATNIQGTENVLRSAHRHRARVILASSSEIYGTSRDVPFRENGPRVLGPTWTHRWSYSSAKAIDEHLAFAYADRGLAVSIVRYFNAYGPRIDERGYGSVIARFAGQALRGDPITVHGDGLQTRCFTYVSDTVRGTLLAASRTEAIGNVFNIGAAEEISIRDLADRIRKATGSISPVVEVPYETDYPRGFEDTRRRVPDVRRAEEVLGFAAEVPLEQGLATTLTWCRANYAREQQPI